MKQPRPKYQVFISSTYKDLHEERARVTWAVLNARHIPAGMENFTATTDRGWETICRVIDVSDYYVVILAGWYGSVDDTVGISWTQREYEYAIAKEIPVLGFIREDGSITQDKTEQDESKRKKVMEFKRALRQKHLVQTWTDAEDLARKVVEAIRNHINDDEDADHARPGWYRGDKIFFPSNVADELARLSSENEDLRRQVEKLRDTKSVVFELVDRDDINLIDEFKATQSRLVLIVRDPGMARDVDRDVERFAMSMGTSVSDGEYKKFLDTINRSVEFRFKIKNTGNKAARDVVVDLRLDACERIGLDPPARPHPSVYVQAARVGSIWKTNAREHVYIDQHHSEGGVGTVRQRIKGISPGVSEEIVPLWVTTTRMSGSGWSMTCSYTVTDSEGASINGSFQIRVDFSGDKSISGKDIEKNYK